MPRKSLEARSVHARPAISTVIRDVVRDAIDAKWRAVGGAPGAPTVPGEGIVSIGPLAGYRDYTNGRIYYAEGAFWVQGLILARYLELGGPGSWLGLPRSDELDFSEGGKVSVFERGSIYWWPDVGTRELNDVVVHYTGLHAFGETDVDHGSSDDEPYATLGVVGADGSTRTFRSRIYDEVDAGEGRFDVIELYRGKPGGLTISTLLQEHSNGDTELSRRAMEQGLSKAGPYLAAGASAIPVFGPILGPASTVALEAFKGEILGALNSFIEATLGFADRPLGADVIELSPKQMILLATRPEGHVHFNDIPWRFETQLMSRYGASYKVYFNIFGA